MTTQRDVDVVVVGAGIVGLACGAGLARAGHSVLMLERGEDIARETTSRNSEVIHAGIYYPQGSLKATLCVAGRRALYQRCTELGVAHAKLGKLIVATHDGEIEKLEALKQSAALNDVDLELLDGERVHKMAPEVTAVAALWSPETGVVDGQALSLSYLAEAEAHGAVLMRCTELLQLEQAAGLWRVRIRNADGEQESLVCGGVVNAAGLQSDRVAELAGMDVDAAGYRLRYCKGDYFALAPGAGRGLSVEHLIYPLPAGPGLGVHLTLDLAGRVRFGPDTEYVSGISYDVDPAKAEGFARAVSRYLPQVEPDWLVPDYAGIRPKLSGPGEGFRDFVVEEESGAGLPGLVNCVGIESPGLTASAAIAARVVEQLAGL